MGEFDSRRRRPYRPSVDGGGLPRRVVDAFDRRLTEGSKSHEPVSSLNEGYFIQRESEWQIKLNQQEWLTLEEDAQDAVRYTLETHPEIDWPSWIPREDALGPIISRRGRMDKSYGPSFHTDSGLTLDQGRFREERDQSFPPTDPAAGAGKG